MTRGSVTVTKLCAEEKFWGNIGWSWESWTTLLLFYYYCA